MSLSSSSVGGCTCRERRDLGCVCDIDAVIVVGDAERCFVGEAAGEIFMDVVCVTRRSIGELIKQ